MVFKISLLITTQVYAKRRILERKKSHVKKSEINIDNNWENAISFPKKSKLRKISIC